MTTSIDKPVYGSDAEGCWFDCARGQYIGDAVIQTAVDHGWKCDVEPADAPPWQSGLTWTDHEHYHELWDEAEEFMQQFAADGFYFGTSDGFGDWGLWAIDCDEEDADEE